MKTLLITLRVLAAAELLLGLLLWTGTSTPWRGVHLGLGVAFGVALLALGVVTSRATGRATALLVTASWTALVIVYALAHPRLWPGAHWTAQLLHVLTGLATVGVAERVARPLRRAVA